ncbi:MAG: family 16 glycosylhydrolase [Saprospiraceae bacterium]
MTKPNITYLFYLKIFSLVFLISCVKNTNESTTNTDIKEPVKEVKSITIQAEDFLVSNGNVNKEEGKFISTASDESWITFDVDIPVAGRYKFEINASAQMDSSTAWMEDYIDNKDGREYNVTGSIPISKNNTFTILSKDGSPLNKGLHKMKLHLKGKDVKVDWFKFSLMKNHQLTPKKMTQKTDGKEWKVVWSDEFDGKGMIDTSKWTFDIGDWGWGNNELQYYTENRLKNARQEGGNLIIESHKNDMNSLWTSARLTTRGKVTFLYGRIEFRAKVPTHRGNWAAGWTLGDDYVDELSWPYCGEIDILESVGFEIDDETGDGTAHASTHNGAYYFKLGNHQTGILDVKNMNKEFHTYAIDWGPESMIATVDGIEYFTYTDDKKPLAWPFGKHQNIILNLAMGGGWGGAEGMDESMTSQQFILDYVRVYEKQ